VAETLPRLLGSSVASAGGDAALIAGGDEYSYAWLNDASARVAGGLLALGVRKGDRVALWLPNCPEWFALFFGCARIGAIAVAVNTRYRSVEVGDIVSRSGATWLAMWPGFRGIDFPALLKAIDPALLSGLEGVIAVGDGIPPEAFAERQALGFSSLLAAEPAEDASTADDGVAIFTTSGTTSAPKFVLHNQAGVVRHATDAAAALGYGQSGAVMLQALPFCGVFGFCQAMATVAVARPMVLMSAFDATEAVDLVRRHKVTHIKGTDDMFRLMLAEAGDRPFETLLLCGYAAFNSDPNDLVALGDRRGMPLVGLYGMSEVQALFAAQPVGAPAETRALAGGIPVSPYARVRARDPESGELLPDGQPGALEMTGPSRMVGYFGNQTATNETITADGFVRTGDLGYTTPEGFVFLSRMGDALRLGGFLVSPAEIAAHIEAFAGVGECQVVGARRGGKPVAVAFVTMEEGAEFSETAILEHCRAGLAGFKVPARVIRTERFPMAESANGMKVQRAKLREIAQAELAQ